MTISKRASALLTAASFAAPAFAAMPALAQESTLPGVLITATAPNPMDAPLTATALTNSALDGMRSSTSDTASLFSSVAGVSTYTAGGVSSLPAIHGLGADRVNLLVNGMQVEMACANEMNTPLSYIDPSQIGMAEVIAGITPVSLGGDSIGGTIAVDSPTPRFSTDGSIQTSGRASVFYRSNARALGGSVEGTVAGENFSMTYSGADVSAHNYKGGGNDGTVHSTEYESANHSLSLAYRNGTNLFVLDLSQQYIPRQGFPNQWMDMLYNRSLHANARYQGTFDWGSLEAQVYWQKLRHYMNFLDDKGGSASGGMPMDTRSQTYGYALKATFNLSDMDMVRIGSDFVNLSLDDWWSPVAGSMMMGPLTYKNIVDGKRTRLGVYGEWQRTWSSSWTSLLGVRSDTVWSNAGDVQPYSWTSMMNMADAMAATAFNAASHSKTDANLDLTALFRYTPEAHAAYEFGYGRKSRAPTLYERYSWGQGEMSSEMIGWFGDGNGYVGNLDLKSEVAHTFSATAHWNGGTAAAWEIKISPYYTRIDNYIGVKKLQDLSGGFVQLQFINQDADLYGADLNASLRLWDSAAAGKGDLKLAADWVHGTDLSTGGDLYHLMPINATLTLEHTLGPWQSAAELELVGKKSQTDTVRNEPLTPAYAVMNLRGSYTWDRLRFDAGIENLFDTAYDLPLGGISLGDYIATGVTRPVPGAGRSFNIAITVSL